MSDKENIDRKELKTPEKKLKELIVACQANNADAVEKLIKEGINVDELDLNKRSAIFYCIDHDELSCLKLLAEAKADVNLQDKDGYSCLHLAVIGGNKLMVETLHKYNANLNVYDIEMHSLIHWSIVCGHSEILDYLLKNNCNTETSDIHGAYPIHYAAQMCGQIDVWDENILRNPQRSLIILKNLIQHKVRIDVEDHDKRNPIIWAASSGSPEAIEELYNAGGNPIKHEKDGLTPLHCAASRGHVDCVKILLEKCLVPIDIMDNNDCTPLFYSVTLGQVEVTEFLLSKRANLMIQDCKGRTVYHCAAAKGQIESLELLCKHDPNIWIPNKRGDFPIHEAYYGRHMECVYFLLNELKHLNVIQSSNKNDGRTLLHLAAAENDDEFCEKLLANGAFVNALMKTSAGTYLTPLDVSRLRHSKDCIEIIIHYGGTTGSKVATIAALKIQRNLKKYIDKKIEVMSKAGKFKIQRSKINIEPQQPLIQKTETTHGTSKLNGVSEKSSKINSNNVKIFRDKSAQTLIRSTTQKLIVVTSTSSNNTSETSEMKDLTESKKISRSTSVVSEHGSFEEDNTKHKSRYKQQRNRDFDKKIEKNILKPIKIEPKSSSKNKLVTEKLINNNSLSPQRRNKRYTSEKHLKNNENRRLKDDLYKIHRKTRGNSEIKRPPEINLSSNTHSFTSDTSSNDSLSFERVNTMEYVDNPNHNYHHYHCHHHCHHHEPNYNNKKFTRTSESENEDYVKKQKLKTKHNFDVDEKKLKVKTTTTATSTNTKNNEKIGLEHCSTSISNVDFKTGDNKKKVSNNDVENDEEDNVSVINLNQNNDDDDEESHLVKLIIKSSMEQNGINNYQSLFERQRLLLKSLYEIRRSRLNNRNIIINADLNNLLLKCYNFDIQKNCKSLKDLEKFLEILAMDIGDEFKKYNKKSKTMVKINKLNSMNHQTHNNNVNKNTSSLMILPNCTSIQSSQNKHVIKAKSLQLTKTNTDENQQQKLVESEYLKQKKQQQQNLQLKVAYKPLLPDDIYRHYYDKTSRLTTLNKPNTISTQSKDKTIFLPVIRNK